MRMRPVYLLPLFLVLACGEPEAVGTARRTIRTEDVPRVLELLRTGRERHRVGITKAARLIAPAFAGSDPAAREARLRRELTGLRSLPRGIEEFVTGSALGFLAAIGPDGKVIARDGEAEQDRLKGQPFASRFPAVQRALEQGQTSVELVEFEPENGQPASVSLLFVAPVRDDGGIIGAVAGGIPLRLEARRLSNQLRLEHASEVTGERLVLWVYLYRGDRLFFRDTSPDIDQVVPHGGALAAGLARSPGGYTDTFKLHGVTYAYGVVPVPSLGDDVGVIVVRSAK